MKPLAVIGKVIEVNPIVNADRIRSAVVVCGESGKWTGVVGLSIEVGAVVTVFLQDALLPPNDRWAFMAKQQWRVKIARFRGAPSECLIVEGAPDLPIGTDLTHALGVTKFERPIPQGMAGDVVGMFPTWLPKTDEDNFQRSRHLVERMRHDAWYATEKADGTSSTVWNDADGMHVCSRNLELKEFSENGVSNLYWRMARKYELERIPQGLAVQFEIVGPGIQGNPMGLKEQEIRLFSVWNRERHKYESFAVLSGMRDFHNIPMAEVIAVKLVDSGHEWTDDVLRELADVKYPNGKPGEGVVIRALDSSWSFKVINPLYES